MNGGMIKAGASDEKEGIGDNCVHTATSLGFCPSVSLNITSFDIGFINNP
jgi:hypothetical protein